MNGEFHLGYPFYKLIYTFDDLGDKRNGYLGLQYFENRNIIIRYNRIGNANDYNRISDANVILGNTFDNKDASTNLSRNSQRRYNVEHIGKPLVA
jgi:hypothetical protein